jgi:hypothetical protein
VFKLQGDGGWDFTPGNPEPEPPAEPAPETDTSEEPAAEQTAEAPEPDDGPPTFLMLMDDWTRSAREDGDEIDCFKAEHHLRELAREWSRLVPYDPKSRESALAILTQMASVCQRAVEDLDIVADYETDAEVLFGTQEPAPKPPAEDAEDETTG